MIFPVVMYRCKSWTIKKDQAPKNWCVCIEVLEKTCENPLDSKEIKLVNPKRKQPWMFIGRTDAEAEPQPPICWPTDVKSRLTGKDLDARKDWWHHWLNEHEFEQTLGDGEGQGSLARCSPWGHKESDTTEQLKNNQKMLQWEVLIEA